MKPAGIAVALLLGSALLVNWSAMRPPRGGAAQDPPIWGPDVRLTSSPADSRLTFNFAWSVAADGNGGIHAVWWDSRDGHEQVYYKRSPEGGATWEPDTRLAPSAAGQSHPAIAATGASVFVAWRDTRDGVPQVYVRRSTDRGRSWDEPIRITTLAALAGPVSIAAAGARVQVVWMDDRHDPGRASQIYTARSADGGATWEPEQRLSDLPYINWVPTVAVSGDRVCAAWVSYRDANEEEYLKCSADGGATWGPDTRLTYDPRDSWAPAIAFAGNTLHVVWFDRRAAGVTDQDIEARLDEALALMGLPVEGVAPRDPATYYLPPLEQRVQARKQRIMLAAPGWVQRGGDPARLEAILRESQRLEEAWSGGFEIFYKSSPDGGTTWGPDTRLTDAPGVSARPSIAVAGAELHVVWFDLRDGNAEVYYKGSRDGGSTWGPDERLTNAPGDSMHPTVALSDTAMHVIWFDERDGNPEIYYKRGAR